VIPMRASLWILAYFFSMDATAAAGAVERTCIESSSGRFGVSVQEDGQTWQIEDANAKQLGKIELTCRVRSPNEVGGVALPLAASDKVCLGDLLPNLNPNPNSAECVVQKIIKAGLLPWTSVEEELPAFTPSELDTKLIGSGRRFWLGGRIADFDWKQFYLTDGKKDTKVTTAGGPIFEDGDCAFALGQMDSPNTFAAVVVLAYFNDNNPPPRTIGTLRKKLYCPLGRP
jgi:cytochrome c-type biogenesis protein CcmE